MNRFFLILVLACCIVIHVTEGSEAQTLSNESPSLSGQWFLSFRSGESNGRPDSQFLIKRGYITVRKKLTESFSGRITPDISVDREGDGEGDLEMRLKYCYVDFDFDDLGFFTAPNVEFGLVHRPWTDFEYGLNRYRLQGTLFLDRNNVFSSADFGVTFFTLLGGEMDDDYKDEVNGKYPGRYGSIALGLYNGGGYHAIEQNNNKAFEGRLTVRPLPDIAPGVQLSYLGVYGKGNTKESPDWTVSALFASLEHRRYVVTGMYYTGDGDFRGKALDTAGDALEQSGYSVFGELKFLRNRISMIGRYDFFDNRPDTDKFNVRRIITGVAYHIDSKTKVLLDYDIVTRDSWSDYEEGFVQVTVEYGF